MIHTDREQRKQEQKETQHSSTKPCFLLWHMQHCGVHVILQWLLQAWSLVVGVTKCEVGSGKTITGKPLTLPMKLYIRSHHFFSFLYFDILLFFTVATPDLLCRTHSGLVSVIKTQPLQGRWAHVNHTYIHTCHAFAQSQPS